MFQLLVLFLAVTASGVLGSSPTVEVYFMVDQLALDRYIAESSGSTQVAKVAEAKEEVTKEVDYYITEINKLFASLEGYGQDKVDLRVGIRKLEFLDANIFNSSVADADYRVNPEKGLEVLDEYLAGKGSFHTLNYDAAILWTGFDLHRSTGAEVAGFAHMDTICEGLANGIVEFDGTYGLVGTTAHELGHILNVTHDTETTGYVMTPTSTADSENRWKFSLESAKKMKAKIQSLSPNCLKTQSDETTIPKAGLPEYLKDPNNVCKRSENDPESYLCFQDETSGDALCGQLQCATQVRGRCNSAYAMDGSLCANRKACKKGKCMRSKDPDYKGKDNSCLFGDQKFLNFNGATQSCTEIMEGYGARQCFQDNIKRQCCATCKIEETGIEGCEYGDAKTCDKYRPLTANFCSANAALCCEGCLEFS